MNQLPDVRVERHGRVVSVSGEDAVAIRLLEMDLTPGVAFSLVGTAPPGDPLELDLRGCRLSLRTSEAQRVRVAAGD